MTQPRLKHFRPSEFGVWYPVISGELLIKLDELRERWGRSFLVSPHPDGVGRITGGTSQHDVIGQLGTVKAVDVFPTGSGADGSVTAEEKAELLELAVEIGFTGIGFYTDTHPRHMMHVDVRDGDVATWARVDGSYVGIREVLA